VAAVIRQNDEQIMEKNIIIVQTFRHTHFLHLKEPIKVFG